MSVRSLRSAVGYHVIMRLDDSRVIAESAAELRIAARVLHDHGASRQLLATAVSDTHGHTLLACTREQAGTFARYAEGALVTRLKLAARFERARIRPVRDQSHLGNTFWYVLRQAAHHGVLSDPMHEGSSLPDLLGLRVTGAAVRAAVRAKLPRISQEALLQVFGLPLAPQPFDLALLGDAACAALGLPHLGVVGLDAQHAREAAVVVAGGRASTRELSAALDVSPRTVERYRGRAVAPELKQAVLLQLRARTALKLRNAADIESLAALSGDVRAARGA